MSLLIAPPSAPPSAHGAPRAGDEARAGRGVAAGVSAVDPRLPSTGRIDPVTQASAAWQGRPELHRGGKPDRNTPAGPPPTFKWTHIEKHLALVAEPVPEPEEPVVAEALPTSEPEAAAQGRMEADVTTLRSLEEERPEPELDVKR